jgi:hypothetical protein
VKLPALKGGASRKGTYLFPIASLNPALKGGACREANRSKFKFSNVLNIREELIINIRKKLFAVLN